jgi:hypothetical protein
MMSNQGTGRCNSPQGLALFLVAQQNVVKDRLHISFVKDRASKVTYDWIVTTKQNAEFGLAAYLHRKSTNPRLGACILIGRKAAKTKGMDKLLKGMRLVHEGRGGQEFQWDGGRYLIPYSFCIYHDLPSCQAALVINTSRDPAAVLEIRFWACRRTGDFERDILFFLSPAPGDFRRHNFFWVASLAKRP